MLPVGTYQLHCQACRSLERMAADAAQFDCTTCHRRNFLIRCERCGNTSILAGSRLGPRSGRQCWWCQQQLANIGLTRRRSRWQATAADALQSLAHHGLDDPDAHSLTGFITIAGSGDCPPNGTLCTVAALAAGVLIVAEIGAEGRIFLPYPDLLELEVGGHGIITTGGGFFGMGLSGMALASMLNNASRRTHVDSFLRITATTAELILQHPRVAPRDIRGVLSRMFASHLAATRAAATTPIVIHPPAEPPPPGGPPPSAIDELERLTKLHAAGTLTDTEFAAARDRHVKRLINEDT